MFIFSEYGYTCQYNRVTKKRGRISRKAAAAAQGLSPHGSSQNGPVGDEVQRRDITQSRYDGHRGEGTASNASGLTQLDRRQLTDISAPVPHGSVGAMDAVSDTYPAPNGAQRSRNSIQQILSPTVQSAQEHRTTASTSSPNAGQTSQGPAVSTLYSVLDNHGPSSALTAHGYSSEDMVRDSDEALRERPALSISVTSDPGNRASLNGDSLPQTSGYSYRCLEPILSELKCILPISAACELLEIYFAEPCGSLFNGASPFVLTHVLRKRSVLHPTKPRQTTPALLSTILWCTAQTADLRIFHSPGSRRRISDRLYELTISLLRPRDPDSWHRTPGKCQPEP